MSYSKTQARELTRALSNCEASLRALVNLKAGAEKEVVTLADEYFNAVVSAELELMPVEELSKTKLGIRPAPLRQAGYENLAQLKGVSWITLSRLEGIGETSAQRISYAVGKMAENVEDTIKIRFDSENRTEQTDSLIVALFKAKTAGRISDSASELLNGTSAGNAKLISAAHAAEGGLRGFFSSRNTEAAELALDKISALLQGDYASTVDTLIQRSDSIKNLDTESCWQDFLRDSQSYYALLESLTTGAKKSGLGNKFKKAAQYAIQKGLPEELAIEIENVELNLTGLNCTLRPYQLFGVQYILNQGASLLGDEMGLGKTVQAIAAMVCLRNSGGTHFMVVCPAGVLVNWSREIKKHSDLKPIEVHGKDCLHQIKRWQRDGGVAVTTYETISRFTLPEDFTYSMLIADEAHYVKNPQALRTCSLMVLRRKTGRALFMTGTALENNVEEMSFLISCLQPDIAKDVQGVTALRKAVDFRMKVAPVYFRRTRDDVLDELPEKIENSVWCTLGSEERKLYNTSVMNREFMAMRQVSWNISDPEKSVKAQQLKSICEESVENGKKVLVFSFFINTLDQAQKALDCKVFGPINGSVSPAKRQQLIDDFTAYDGGAVLVSQIQAGGTGLNIQAASVIVFCEPQIKPSLETQAISRAYRMGQTNTVLVYRLLCENTVDERIMQILDDKQELFDNFAEKSVSGAESLTLGESEYNSIMEAEAARLSQGDGAVDSAPEAETE